jgi:membrane protein
MSPVRRATSVVMEAVNLWTSRNAFQHAGALAFYTLFSMAPLMIILVTITGAVFGDEAATGELKAQIHRPDRRRTAPRRSRGAVLRSRIEEAGLLATLLGVGALLFGATTVFAQMQASLNQFWGVVAKPSRSGILVFATTRLVSLGVVIVIGFLLLTSLVMSMVIMAAIEYFEGADPDPAARRQRRGRGAVARQRDAALRDDLQDPARRATCSGRTSGAARSRRPSCS